MAKPNALGHIVTSFECLISPYSFSIGDQFTRADSIPFCIGYDAKITYTRVKILHSQPDKDYVSWQEKPTNKNKRDETRERSRDRQMEG
ncbi:hypothetical protein J4732_19850 [Serratia marcescens]|uniref:Uncharacterized protein n=1 Tax=Serratia marcescens TaxID=615 RepID=A0A939NRY5_SERMA|nr:hypothetical protein [Serratia marcescens]